jgi:hypothetical protein
VFDIINTESEVREMTREELIQNLDGIVTKHPKSDWSIYQRNIVDKAIEALNQEPKRGKWLAIRTKDDTHEITCSCCKHVRSELLNHHISEESLRSYLKDITAEYKYCYNCGAQMEGEVRE